MASTVQRATLVFVIAAAMAAPSIAHAQARGRSGGGGPPSAQGAPRTGPASAPVGPSRAGTAVSRGPAGPPVTGGAVPRPPGSGGPGSINHPIYGSPWYGYGYGYPYYPYYGYGYGYGYGYPYYGFAFGYPYYGYPYYGYGGFGYYGPGVSVGVQVGGGSEAVHSEGAMYAPPARMGSVRLRISPGSGQVYIDGALAGTVDEFGGLSSHLDLPAGPHDLEVRAPGFQTYRTRIFVEADRTTTTRGSLSKK